MPKPQWADGYGAQWYRHYDGRPPLDDDNSYYWTGTQWARDFDYDDKTDEDAGEEVSHRDRHP